MKLSLPDEAVTYDVADQLGVELRKKGKQEEAMVIYLAALEGRRRVREEEHKDTISTLNNMGAVLDAIKDYEGALDYYQQALRVLEKVVGKTHPDTLMTIMNMAITYGDGLGDQVDTLSTVLNMAIAYGNGRGDRVKEEEMKRLALDGKEKSLGMGNESAKNCARNLSILFLQGAPSKEKLRELVKQYPHLSEGGGLGKDIRNFI